MEALKHPDVALYDGRIVIQFYQKGRWEGRYQKVIDTKAKKEIPKIDRPSVTNVTGIVDKPALKFWTVKLMAQHLLDVLNGGETIDESHIEEGKRMHTQKLKDASDKGKAVHAWAEDYIKGLKPEFPDDPQIMNGVSAFLQWVNDHKVEFISSERAIYSLKYKYVGRMDAEAFVDGKRCVIDFKTGNALYDEARFQTAAYQKAAEEEDGIEYDGNRIIARFDKNNGDFEVWECGDVDKDFECFLGLRTAQRRMTELEELKKNK